MTRPVPDPIDRNLFRYSRRTFSGVCLFGAIGLLPFAYLRIRVGDTLGAALVVLLTVAFGGLGYWAYSGRRISSWAFLLLPVLCNVVGAVALWRLRDLGIFWFFPLMMAMAYVLPWRWSTPTNLVSVVFAIVSAAQWMPTEHFYRLVATLLLALVFSALFSYNIERQHAILKGLVVTDPLTGAFNRRYFERKMEEARRHWRRTGEMASMVMLDIDHFKEVNDRYGHGAGDRALVALSQFIQAQLRPHDRFFRLGGEEFALLLPVTKAEQAVQLAERIRSRIAEGPLAPDVAHFTVSLGVAELPKRGPLAGWSDLCDAALYAAKESGRNSVVVARSDDTDARYHFWSPTEAGEDFTLT